MHMVGATRIAVTTFNDARAKIQLFKLRQNGFSTLEWVGINDVYTVSSALSEKELEKAASLLYNPVAQKARITKPLTQGAFDWVVEIGWLPGVTDNLGKTAEEIFGDFFGKKARELRVFSSQEFFLKGAFSQAQVQQMAGALHNPLVQRAHVKTQKQFLREKGMGTVVPQVKLARGVFVKEINLNVSDAELAKIGNDGILETVDENGKEIRRGPLALDVASMKIIQAHFRQLKRNPTDVELESLAQTWSEHCKHTIFAAEMDEIKGGLFKEKIRLATEIIRKKKGKTDRCVSVFSDNAGGIVFDEEWIVCDKVETHNSPSALDPFGGAITGIVGVNRDVLGFGKSAKPVANRYGFCFGIPSDPKKLFRARNAQSPVLSPKRIMQGVVEGVRVGGNCSGIPTPQGFVFFDERYAGKPLVFVGTVGLIPRTIAKKPAHEKKARPGDCIIMVGGRVGMDGIHGATFSSEALSANSPATAVQIGDPITQKKMSDAIVKEARGLDLFSSITDNGAGGLSCSVAEMARESGGFEVDLEKVPLKYPNLAPWKIWISESQERMTLAIPRKKLETFLGLMKKRDVEATVIGRFTRSGKCVVRFNKKKVMDLSLKFLHDGLPQKQLKTRPFFYRHEAEGFEPPSDYNSALLEMLGRLNVGSQGWISTQFDHEVQASSVLKPLQGAGQVNALATVIRPVLSSKKGLALSQALFPSYGDLDCYWMAANAIEAAIRNLVSVGVKMTDIVLLDNFCWCSSHEPERLRQLKEAAQACFDFATGFGTPFISGKDSMFNDFKGFDENGAPVKISVPPTLLISSLGVVSNVEKCVSMDAKMEGDDIWVVGETKNEVGGSEYLANVGEKTHRHKKIGKNVPKVDLKTAKKTLKAISALVQRELAASIQPVGLGGIATALAKTLLAGKMGCAVELQKVPCAGNVVRNDILLFSESTGRVIVTASPRHAPTIKKILAGVVFSKIGTVRKNRFALKGRNNEQLVDLPVRELEKAYHKAGEQCQ